MAGIGIGLALPNGFNQNIESTGLTTVSTTVPYAGSYFVKGKLTIPTIVGGGGNSLVIVTVFQNGVSVYTGLSGAEGFYKNLLCAAFDVIAITLTSTAVPIPDAVLNSIKGVYSIGQGQ